MQYLNKPLMFGLGMITGLVVFSVIFGGLLLYPILEQKKELGISLCQEMGMEYYGHARDLECLDQENESVIITLK